jgi:hypothetical protein
MSIPHKEPTMIKAYYPVFGDRVKDAFDLRHPVHGVVIASIARANGVELDAHADCYDYLSKKRFQNPASYGMAQGHIVLNDDGSQRFARYHDWRKKGLTAA